METFCQSILKLFIRDLNRLIEEIKAFKQEDNLWITPNQVNNSAGHLTMHLIGNLNHFIGNEIGNTGYVRNRDSEFNGEPKSVSELILEIEATKIIVSSALENVKDSLLRYPFPAAPDHNKLDYRSFLIHLIGHLNYHLGQISYTRRVIEA